MIWQTARGRLDLGDRAIVMGILNVTPDSFFDGGRFSDADSAVRHGLEMFGDGASIVDVGGESTRPGAASVSAAEERRRVVPVITGLLSRAPDGLLSVDTSKAEVALAALEAGAAIVNDVTALRGDARMAAAAARHRAGVVLMHMQGTPRTMQQAPAYRNVVQEVRDCLAQSIGMAHSAGIAEECLALDPGIGFGKTVPHNLELLRHLADLRVGSRPLVVGVSRKSFLSKISPATTLEERLWPTLALTALLRASGAEVLRVHDVRANVAALRAVEAVLGTG